MYFFNMGFFSYPPAQVPADDPLCEEHSTAVKQVPLRKAAPAAPLQLK